MSHWLDHAQERDALAQGLDRSPLALDTEFIRERTFYPRLALVQLRAANGDAYLIDPMALPEAGALRTALQDDTLKIMHSPSEDIQAFQRGWSLVIGPVFDTQLAAALIGLGPGKSYQRLVEELLGIHLEKGETRSDWLQRPLTDSQRRYAAEDVLHLHELHARLDQGLRELGRLDWLTQDCVRLVETASNDAPDPNPHLASRAAQHLDPPTQALLRRLLLWRESMARHHDRPRSWILDNELVVELATRTLTRSSFNALLDRHPRAPRRNREELWQAVSSPLTEEDLVMPLAAPPNPSLRAPLKAMQAVVAEHASALNIPEGLLCAKRHLETLLQTRQWPHALDGWRRGILESDLLTRLP
ncbi:MAG: HRDC domain-containing protein [Xanthomonadales bacterium]|nr:HRDC domain-containing protein [Xanthomonadales bacterium]